MHDNFFLDPLEIDAPLVRQPFHFMSPEQQTNAPDWMKSLAAKIKETQGFVLVSPEYNATLSPALTNLLDYFPPGSYRHKPVSIITYSLGSLGGVRARVAALPFVSELGMVALPTTVVVPSISQSGIDENGEGENERVFSKLDSLCEELKWYIDALQTQAKAAGGNPK